MSIRVFKVISILGLVAGLCGCSARATLPESDGHGAEPHATGHPGSAGLTGEVPVRPLPLVIVHSEATLQLLFKGRSMTLHSPEDVWLRSRRLEKNLLLEHSGWVFVGYGLTVPALGWDHYRQHDVRGKTVVMLEGAPAIPDGTVVSSRAALEGPGGYGLGHWRAKLDNARRHGAAVALIIRPLREGESHVPVPEEERFDAVLVGAETSRQDPLAAFGWVPEQRLADWLRKGGMRWEPLKRRASAADFSPVDLPLQGRLRVANHWQEVERAIPQ